MTLYPTEKLMELWANGKLTNEQMIGQLLQHIIALQGHIIKIRQEQVIHQGKIDPTKQKRNN